MGPQGGPINEVSLYIIFRLAHLVAVSTVARWATQNETAGSPLATRETTMGCLVRLPGAPTLGHHNVITVAAVRYVYTSTNSIINFIICSKLVEAMLDSGSSVSLIRSNTLLTLKVDEHLPIPPYNFHLANP